MKKAKKEVHPFEDGVEKRSATRKHSPFVWENMFGTVYARDPHTEEVKYFDYNYAAAREFAKVSQCTDLQVARNKRGPYMNWPRLKKLALWGIIQQQQPVDEQANVA